MRRGLFLLNLFLSLLLAFLVALDGWDFLERRAYAAGVSREIPAGSIRLEKVSDDGAFLRFPEWMVGEDRVGKPLVRVPLVLEPPRVVSAWWEAPDLLHLVPARPLPRALRFHLRLAGPLVSLSGRRVDPALDLVMETPTVRLEQVVTVFPGEKDLEPWRGKAVLTFDLPLPAGSLASHLEAWDLRGRPLDVKPEGSPKGKGKVFMVVFSRRKGERKKPLSKAVVCIRPGLLPLGGEVPLGRALKRLVTFRGRLLLREVSGKKGRIFLRFNGDVPLPGKGWIQVRPALPFQVARDWGKLILLGDFLPGRVYQVLLKKGFPGKGPRRLRRDASRAILVPDLKPAVRFASRGRVLSSRALPELELRAVNLESCRVEIRSLYPNNAVIFAGFEEDLDFPGRLFGPWRGKVYPLGGPRNRETAYRIPLSDLLGPETRGIHQVRVRGLDRAGRPAGWWRERILQVTDLGITARVAPGEVALRVTSLATGRGLPGARVRVFSPANQLLAEGITRKGGIARLACPPSGADRVPFVVEARLGKDRSFLDLRHDPLDLLGDEQAGRPYLTRGVEAYVFMDRGILRPGETARATVLVRDPACRAASGRRLEARWIDPSGRVREKEELQVPGSGLLALEKKTSLSASTGAWSLEIREKDRKVGEATFRVDAFVPDRLEVKARPGGPFFMGGEGIVLVEGNWLEGSPAGKRPGRLLVRFDRARIRFKGYEDFSFGPCGREVPPGAGEPVPFALDREGRARIRLDLPFSKAGVQAYAARVGAEVEDPSGRPARGGFETKVFRRGGILGIRADGKGADLVLLDRSGRLLDASPLVEVVHQVRRWGWRRKNLGGFSYTYETYLETREVERKEVRLRRGRARVEFGKISLEGPGWPVLSARLGRVRAEQAAGEPSRRPDRLRVTCLNAPVPPGGTARIALDAPFGGRAFLTLEGAGIHGAHVYPVKPGHTVLEVPVPRGIALPNLHAVVTLTRPQAGPGAAPPFLVAGGAPFALARPERRAEVTLEYPGKVRPGSKVALEIRAPGATRAVAALVDEGVLRITGHPSPDPLGWFLAGRRNDTKGADTRVSLYENPRFEAPPVRGGGSAPRSLASRLEGSISPLIEPVALWSGPVRLDREGRGKVLFQLPPYEGRLRVMVLASGPERVGSASGALVVSSPLGLLAAGPRMLSPGDESRVVVTLANRTGRPAQVRLNCRPLGGAELAPGVEPSPLLLLRKGETRNLELPVVAGQKPGKQGVEIQARWGKVSRKKVCLFLARRPSLYCETRRGFVVRKRGGIRVPGEWSPRGLAVRLRAGGGLEETLLPLLVKMVRYPYGCVEQTASRGFALLAAGRLLPRLRPEGGLPAARSMIESAVDRILSMQGGRGGLSLWPGGEEEYPFGTVYGLDFLLSAAARGFHVPPGAVNALLDRVRSYLGRGGDLCLECYAARVLARGGRPVGPWLTLLAAKAKEAGEPEALAWTALGLAGVGRKGEACRLLSLLSSLPPRKEREQGGLLRSPLSALALEVRARLALAPASDRTALLLGRLEQEVLRPEELTTRETAQALLALSAYERAAAKEAKRFSCRLSWPGGSIRPDRPRWVSPPLRGGEILRVESGGTVFGFLEIRGYRLDAGGRGGAPLARKILDPATGKEARVFRRGRVYTVRLEGTLSSRAVNVCVTDLLPGGFEPEGGAAGVALLDGDGNSRSLDAVEFRDDRVLAFRSGALPGKFALEYKIRAVFPGLYFRPPAQVESLYDPGRLLRGAGGGRVEILP